MYINSMKNILIFVKFKNGKSKFLSKTVMKKTGFITVVITFYERNMPNPGAKNPIPIWILKQCKDELLPTITDIFSLSLSSDKLIKKSSLGLSEYKNYMPVSNLGCLSKVIERVVADQTISYFSANILDDELQSAYRKKH